MAKKVQTDINMIEDYFDSEKLAECMIHFLSNITSVKNDIDGGYIETHIGEKDGRGYVYVGIEDTHNMIGGKSVRGSSLWSESKLVQIGNIKINTIFTNEAREAVDKLKDTSDDWVYNLMTDIESYRKLIYPINFSMLDRNEETKKLEVKPNAVTSNYYDKSMVIAKIVAKYDPEINRCPLRFFLTNNNSMDSSLLKEDLVNYLRTWHVNRVVGESNNRDEIIEFSSANYVKTVVLQDKVKGYRLVFDSKGMYFIKNNNVVYLGALNEDNLRAAIEDFNIPKKFERYINKTRYKLLFNHSKWIVPYRCGDMKIIEI